MKDRVIVLGDFNQRIPPKWQKREMWELLDHNVLKRFPAATQGLHGPDGKQTIDHICLSRDLQKQECGVLSNLRLNDGNVSDHFGVTCSVVSGDVGL